MPDYTIGAVGHAMAVLEVVARAPRPVTLTEIVRTAGISKNTVFRTLQTLEAGGFVGVTERRWYLGHRLMELTVKSYRERLRRWQKTIGRTENGEELRGDGAAGSPQGPAETTEP